ncbi:MAG TPA: lamin tail domain-containing protein [Bacteroidales bacterium]|jgi:hypothetical protein|nr:lamin tail domain-containing protein [Bacteroidales bacterium]MDI9574770.1 lamin tail domain-containing protein [Bacteroidota bacterium]OQC59790.1 MAG: Intermediate filament tail domain protein [Bacteroidetes bacterium ADurb.Bin012]MBP9511933.1 lamin tail domain-containing protein [Bacteroidales bacterium]MBP9588431.1 lamin tail domain-containing protein [Bacteroidales bacterium]
MKRTCFLILMAALVGFIQGCVKDEVFQGPPKIKSVALNPVSPGEGQVVTVMAKVTDDAGVKSVNLYYKTTADFTKVAMQADTANFYKGQIPGQNKDITVSYYIEAENINGMKSYYPSSAPQMPASYKVGAPAIFILINEIYTRGVPEDPDWVEIYNNSDVQMDISGYLIYDAGGQSGAKPKKAFPEGSVIPAHGFLVIVVDDASESGFGLSSGGEEIWLENNKGAIIDDVTFPALEPTQSYGRFPDGSPNWQILSTITKGTSNSPGIGPVANLKINEIYSTGDATTPDWVEIFNAGNQSVDLSGWKIYDNGGQTGTKPKKEFPVGTSIPAGGFFVITVDDGSASGFGLSSNGEEIWLEKPDETIGDDVTFPALETGQSYGRYPDGSDNFQVFYVVTPGTANDNSLPPAAVVLKINEIYSRGDAISPDWIEIYNAGTETVDLTGWKIYDNGGQAGTKPKKEFPSGATIDAGGFYVIIVDDTATSGFGLSSSGETVWLEKPNGTVADEVVFPALEVGQSYGRYPDGSDNLQVLYVITPGAPNDNSTPPASVILKINEIFSRGDDTNPDWIEIYNAATQDVDLTGWKIYDNGGQAGTKPKKEFPAGEVIPANGFYVIITDDAAASAFGLSSNGETVWLENPEGTVVDEVTFPALDVTQSYGRKPDGSDNFFIFTEITRGSSNNNASTLPKRK